MIVDRLRVGTLGDAVANMRQIDEVYRAAGLPLRGARWPGPPGGQPAGGSR